MPQEIHVVCCCNCGTFQSDIVKKQPKWECKICYKKQTLQKVFFTGPGKVCRQVVQYLNQKKSETYDENEPQPSTSYATDNGLGVNLNTNTECDKDVQVEFSDNDTEIDDNQDIEIIEQVSESEDFESKWNSFITDEDFEALEALDKSGETFSFFSNYYNDQFKEKADVIDETDTQ